MAYFTDLQKLVYIRVTQIHQFKMESYLRCWLRDTRYALRTRNTHELAGYVHTVNSKDLFQPQSADSALWPLELIWPFVGPFCQVGPYRPQ